VECADIQEMLLARQSGRVSEEETKGFDEHVEACSECASLVKAGAKSVALLKAYRIATDIEPEADDVEQVLSQLRTEEAERADRARKVQDEKPPDRAKLLAYVVVAVLLLAVTGFAIKVALFSSAPVEPNAILELLDEVTDGRRARDFALLLDVQLQEEWSRQDTRHRRIAALLLARRFARRGDLPRNVDFMKAILVEHASTAMLPGLPIAYAAEGADPLRLGGELELAWQCEAALREVKQVGASAADEDTRKRADVHAAAILALSGRIEEAKTIVDAYLPALPKADEDQDAAATGAAEGGAEVEYVEPPMPPQPEDFIGRIAWHIGDRLRRARIARHSMLTYERPKPDESDYRGGELGFAALDSAFAIESLKGIEEPILVGLLSLGWAHVLQGDFEGARGPLDTCFADAQKRFTRSLAATGLAEIAFLEGRFTAGLGNLGLAKEHAPDTTGPNQYRAIIMLQQATRELFDEGSAPRAKATFKYTRDELEDQGGEIVAFVDEAYEPLIDPLAAKRDEATATWPKKAKGVFDGVYEKLPGEVRGLDFLLIGFDDEDHGFAGEGRTDVSLEPGYLGKALAVSSTRAKASAVLSLKATETETETWAIFTVRIGTRGAFSLILQDDARSRYRWRTVVLQPDRWYRLAVPFGAAESLVSTDEYRSMLGGQIGSIGFELDTGIYEGSLPARFVVDDLMIYHGQGFGDNAVAQPVNE
jgi:hypothetical protein